MVEDVDTKIIEERIVGQGQFYMEQKTSLLVVVRCGDARSQCNVAVVNPPTYFLLVLCSPVASIPARLQL